MAYTGIVLYYYVNTHILLRNYIATTKQILTTASFTCKHTVLQVHKIENHHI